MEDDWLWNHTLIKVPILQRAIELLEYERSSLLGVALRQMDMYPGDFWQQTPSGGIRYAKLLNLESNRYCNGGIVLDREKLLELGPHLPERLDVETENRFKQRVKDKSWTIAIIRTWPVCENEKCDNQSIVYHIGNGKTVITVE